MEDRSFQGFLEYIERYSDKPAYRYFKDGEIVDKSYRDFIAESRSVASFFCQKGYEKRHIAILGPTSVEWVTTYMGTVVSGNVAVPIDRMLSLDEVTSLLLSGHVKTIFLGEGYESYVEKLSEVQTELEEMICFSSETFTQIISAPHVSLPERDEHALAEIIFTSGTTGASKGVMLSQSNLISNAFNACAVNDYDKTVDRVMSVLPIHHTYELTLNNLGSLLSGSCVCINDKLENILKNMQIFRPNVILMVPMMAELFYKKLQDSLQAPATQKRFQKGLRLCKNLRKVGIKAERKIFAEIHSKFGGELYDITVGGAPLREEVAQGLTQVGFQVFQGYGLTECSPDVCANSRLIGNKFGTIGHPLPETKVKFVDGELWVSSPSVMMGYYENPEATAEVLVDGWLKTGDLGYQDEEGWLYITGRKKNVIILDNGKNVYPEELEDHISHIEGIKDVMVYEQNGKICALLLLQPGADRVSVLELMKEYNDTMPTYKKVTGIYFRATEFPKTTTMKIKRSLVLKEIREKETKKKEYVAPTNELEQRICMVFTQMFAMSQVSIDDDFFELGGDSLMAFETAAELGIQAQELYDYSTPRKLAENMKHAEQVQEPRVEDINERIAKTSSQNRRQKPSHVLLTGATGYLGSHILYYLSKEDVQVTCLVRNPKKLKSILNYYFPRHARSIQYQVVKGNIEDAFLGMTEEEYKSLCQQIDTVVHVAANVHHTGHYKDFERTNVGGTMNVIDFCKAAGAVLHHTSTASVSGAGTVQQTNAKAVFDEQILDIGQCYEQNVYIHSKYKAEEKVILAREEGVHSNIYRIGNVTWRWSDGGFQKNAEDNGFVRRCKGLMKVGVYCKELDVFPIDFTQVDKCADAYVRLVMDGEMNRIYHMVNPNMCMIEDLEKKMNVEKVSKEEFDKKVLSLMPDRDVAVLSFYSTIAASSDNIPLLTELTVDKLESLGFKWPKIKLGYLRYLQKID